MVMIPSDLASADFLQADSIAHERMVLRYSADFSMEWYINGTSIFPHADGLEEVRCLESVVHARMRTSITLKWHHIQLRKNTNPFRLETLMGQVDLEGSGVPALDFAS